VGTFEFGQLPRTRDFLDAKLDLRLSDELIANLRSHSKHLDVSISVYVRTILYAYYSKRLVFKDRDGRYRLEKNDEYKPTA
jgi:hypothetical protein